MIRATNFSLSTFSYKSILGLVELNEIILSYMTRNAVSPISLAIIAPLVEPKKVNRSPFSCNRRCRNFKTTYVSSRNVMYELRTIQPLSWYQIKKTTIFFLSKLLMVGWWNACKQRTHNHSAQGKLTNRNNIICSILWLCIVKGVIIINRYGIEFNCKWEGY